MGRDGTKFFFMGWDGTKSLWDGSSRSRPGSMPGPGWDKILVGWELSSRSHSQSNSDSSKAELAIYSDADYASNLNIWKSMSDYIVMFCGGSISWFSKHQDCIMLSSTE